VKIAQVANFYGPKSGGIRTTMLELAKAYADANIKIFHVVPGKRFERNYTEFGEIIKVPSFPLPFSGGYRLILQTKKVIKVLEGINPDVIELHDRITLLPVAEWANRKKIPVVIFIHEVLKDVLRKFFMNTPLLDGWVKKRNMQTEKVSDLLVCTTDFASQEFRQIGSRKIVRIPLGVDLETFSPKKRSEFIKNTYAPDGALLILASRLSKEKNPEFAFKLMKYLKAAEVNAYLLVIGTGPLRRKLQRKYFDLPITFKGFVSNRNEMSILLASGDILLAPGQNETFCLAALEAIASGTPVIANEDSAVKEVILFDGGAVTKANFENWRVLISKLSQDKTIRERARNQALRFTWRRSADLLLENYAEYLTTNYNDAKI
jgi:alpha-1,6-mannosyltransferase